MSPRYALYVALPLGVVVVALDALPAWLRVVGAMVAAVAYAALLVGEDTRGWA